MKKDIIMFYPGADSIVVHPSKVAEMERKGWSLNNPSSSKKKGKKNGDS
tara:strand:+ start:2029 stop:2175 length:147 start_codon:yes stop_codon:yes gene_type:complete